MTAADLHPDTGLPRPGTCCGVCPPIAGGGWDCTCAGLPGCPAAARAEAERRYNSAAHHSDLTYPAHALESHRRGAFVAGAKWAAARAETDAHHTANGLGRLITAATALTIALVPAALWPGTWWAALGLTIGATLIARLAYVAITSKERT